MTACDPLQTLGEQQIHRLLRSGVLVVMAIIAIAVLAFLAPIWATPIAKFWFQPGFEEGVAEALADIPNPEGACIYDDTRYMFVTSVGQLNVERMIENAVRDKAPRLRLNGLQRDPHFRVFNGRNTFYWSFRDQEFHAFRGDRWTLSGTGKRLCEAYMNTPEEYRRAFQGRNGMDVSEANFCCIAVKDP